LNLKLWESNQHLFARLTNGNVQHNDINDVLTTLIAQTGWQNGFVGLEKSEVRKICESTQHGMEDVAPDLKMLFPTLPLPFSAPFKSCNDRA